MESKGEEDVGDEGERGREKEGGVEERKGGGCRGKIKKMLHQHGHTHTLSTCTHTVMASVCDNDIALKVTDMRGRSDCPYKNTYEMFTHIHSTKHLHTCEMFAQTHVNYTHRVRASTLTGLVHSQG